MATFNFEEEIIKAFGDERKLAKIVSSMIKQDPTKFEPFAESHPNLIKYVNVKELKGDTPNANFKVFVEKYSSSLDNAYGKEASDKKFEGFYSIFSEELKKQDSVIETALEFNLGNYNHPNFIKTKTASEIYFEKSSDIDKIKAYVNIPEEHKTQEMSTEYYQLTPNEYKFEAYKNIPSAYRTEDMCLSLLDETNHDIYKDPTFLKTPQTTEFYVKVGGSITNVPKKLRSENVIKEAIKKSSADTVRNLSIKEKNNETFLKHFLEYGLVQQHILSGFNHNLIAKNIDAVIKTSPELIFYSKKNKPNAYELYPVNNALSVIVIAFEKITKDFIRGDEHILSFVSKIPGKYLRKKYLERSDSDLLNALYQKALASENATAVNTLIQALYNREDAKHIPKAILQKAILRDPSIVKTFYNATINKEESWVKTAIEQKTMFCAISKDPMLIQYLRKPLNLRSKFTVARACISQLSNYNVTENRNTYESILKYLLGLDAGKDTLGDKKITIKDCIDGDKQSKSLSNAQILKCLKAFAIHNPEILLEMEVANRNLSKSIEFKSIFKKAYKAQTTKMNESIQERRIVLDRQMDIINSNLTTCDEFIAKYEREKEEIQIEYKIHKQALKDANTVIQIIENNEKLSKMQTTLEAVELGSQTDATKIKFNPKSPSETIAQIYESAGITETEEQKLATLNKKIRDSLAQTDKEKYKTLKKQIEQIEEYKELKEENKALSEKVIKEGGLTQDALDEKAKKTKDQMQIEVSNIKDTIKKDEANIQSEINYIKTVEEEKAHQQKQLNELNKELAFYDKVQGTEKTKTNSPQKQTEQVFQF